MNLDPSQLHDRLGYWLLDKWAFLHQEQYMQNYTLMEFIMDYSLVEQIDEQFADYHFSDGTGNIYKEIWPIHSNGNIQSDKKVLSKSSLPIKNRG